MNAAVIRAIENADIIGLPTAGRLQRDNRHFGYLAYLDGLVTNLLGIDPQRHVADASVNMALHRSSPFLGDILAGQPFIGVIAPHADLARRIAVRHAIPAHTTYLVPGERRLPAHLLAGTVRHFPQRYRAILAELTVPNPGSIFLVAAGLLGKVYCDRVRALGGIAIDIGAVADAWMGYNTRPGQYDDTDGSWTLP